MKIEILKGYRDMPEFRVLFYPDNLRSYELTIPESVYWKLKRAVNKGDIITVRGILKRLKYNIPI